ITVNCTERAIVAQIIQHFAAALITGIRILCQRAHDNGTDSGVNRGVHLFWRDGVFVHDFVDYGGDVLTRNGFFAGDHVVEHDAEGEDVAASVDGAAFDLFGRHIAGRAHDVRGLLYGAELQG